MNKGYTTKFNIGDTVWFIEEETVYGKTCEHCDSRLPNSKVMKIHRSMVTEIFIGKYSESYNLSYPRSLPSTSLYATKEEAASLLELCERK